MEGEATQEPEAAPRYTTGICELALQTDDLAGLERFYTSALGFRVLDRKDDRTWLSCGGHARLGLWKPGAKEFGDRGGRHVHFALSAESGRLDAIARRLDELGVAYWGPVEHPGGDRSIYVEDPEGNLVEVWDFFEEHRREGVDAL